ncbi:flagellar hook assembly protein FlgD [Pyruvatibacter sp. HU-CL02332]|uniref:flagellar hook assembly protein FlgD n=1 Tax=Pyruvatibacter sp. HU-CL02332 TaxID=3127650 RepID=UPI002969BD12|nr:flagellar hook capping FlgD N-terminal domain-containing protein [Alphaproteobacteria bacterium]
MSIEAIAAAQSAQSAASTAGSKLNTDFDTFLTLLTTQLKNQDPLEPLDSSEFTNQLVQFSSVEQNIATNQNLEQLLNLTFANFATDAVGYIGKEVVAESPTAILTDGSANWGYELDAPAEKVQLFVTDAAGRLVHTSDLQNLSGNQTFNWNGKDSNGRQLSDGAYTLRVIAQDAAENEIKVTMKQAGVVSAVEFDNNTPVLTVNGSGIQLSDVITVRDVATGS